MARFDVLRHALARRDGICSVRLSFAGAAFFGMRLSERKGSYDLIRFDMLRHASLC
jgi:hypothetical protein